MSYQDVNAAGSSSAGGNNYDSGPTTGSDPWDNSGAASDAEGFNAGETGDDFGNGSEFDPDASDGDSETDENGDPIEREPQDGDDPDGGQDGGDGTGMAPPGKQPAPVPYNRFQEKVSEVNSWRGPAQAYGIQSPVVLQSVLDRASAWESVGRELNITDPTEILPLLEAKKQEDGFRAELNEGVQSGDLSPEWADKLAGMFSPMIQEFQKFKPLKERLEREEQTNRFNAYLGGLKQQYPNMDETAVVNAARAGGDAEAEAHRTHQLYVNRSRANRQRDVAAGRNRPGGNGGGGSGSGAPRVETRSGGGSEAASPNRIPDPLRDPKGFKEYREAALRRAR